MELGKRKARSPSAIITVVRTLTAVSLSSTVNSSGSRLSHTVAEVHMYLHIARMEVSRSSLWEKRACSLATM